MKILCYEILDCSIYRSLLIQMESDEQLCAWQVEEHNNYDTDLPESSNKLHRKPVKKSSSIPNLKKRKKSILDQQNIKKKFQHKQKQQGKYQENIDNKLPRAYIQNYEKMYKKLRIQQYHHASTEDIYKYSHKRIAVGNSQQRSMSKFPAATKITYEAGQNIERQLCEGENSVGGSIQNQKLISTVSFHPKIAKIIQNTLILKRKYSKMLMDEQKENIPVKIFPEKEQLLSKIKYWSKIPMKNSFFSGQSKPGPRLPPHKVKKCMSSHLEGIKKSYSQSEGKKEGFIVQATQIHSPLLKV